MAAFYRCAPVKLGPAGMVGRVSDPRLDLLKALGDNTRYAIYLELARSPKPLATADIAETLGLHVNTVRPHLERMREVGLLDVQSDNRGAVGRPQHRYSLANDAPSFGLEPPTFPMVARMLLRTAAAAGAGRDEALDAGREQGRLDAARDRGRPCVDVLVAELDRLGFDPVMVADDDAATAPARSGRGRRERSTIAFTHCPFRELAEANPDLVCSLHRGLIEGVIDAVGGAKIVEFGSLVDRVPCQVELAGGRRGDAG